jgi:glutathione S-transferase
MKLYSPSQNFKLDKVLFGSRILGKKLTHIEVPFDHKNKQFIVNYPNFSLPALEMENGQHVFGADSILLVLWEEKICELGNFEQSEIHQWLELAEKELENFTGLMVVNKQSLSDVSEEQLAKAR